MTKDEFGLIELLKKLKPEEAVAIPGIVGALKPEERAGLLEYLENVQEKPTEREEHEPRMRMVMLTAATAAGLQWESRSPTDHPFGARLDGAILHKGRRVAVVELEAKNRKQIDGSLLDLLTHPERKKVLVIGRSKVVPYPLQLKREIVEKVLPVLQKLLNAPAEIAVFTESELKVNPDLLGQFIGPENEKKERKESARCHSPSE